MDAILSAGIELILWIQSMRNPALDAFFRGITALGGAGHLFMVPALVWCLSYRMGSRLLLTLLLSACLNFALKDLFGQPRPFQMEPRIGPDRELGYGIPSGHAQHTAVEWALVAAWVGKPLVWAGAIVLITLIGFSRVYLGVHFPSDVLAGWALAALIVWLHLRYLPRVEAFMAARSVGGQIGLALLGSGIFIVSYLLLPKTPWVVGTGGLFFGAAAGMAVCARWLRAPEGGAWWQRLLRYPLGIVPLLLWSRIAGGWVPEGDELSYFLVIYGNLAVAGFWITAGAPALFQIARLSPPR
ncbi:MAG: phosphatase PAP2 family protein [Gammaproteobacteria bacterium]